MTRYRRVPPEVFLLDIGLPGMVGKELARRSRAIAATASTALIAIAGHGQEGHRHNAVAAGFDYHLLKSTDAEDLLAILPEITNQPELRFFQAGGTARKVPRRQLDKKVVESQTQSREQSKWEPGSHKVQSGKCSQDLEQLVVAVLAQAAAGPVLH